MTAAPDVDRLEIHAPGLLIRPWRAGDARQVYEAGQDPDIQRWTSVPRPYLPEHAEGFVTLGTRRAWRDGTGAPLGVFDADTGELLGSNGLITIDRHRGEGEVGYWTAPWARGRGVATRATHAVAQWFFLAGMRRLQWRAEVGNHASKLVAERLGFTIEGVLRDGIWRGPEREGPANHRVDCWIGSLLPGELRDPTQAPPPWLALRAATFGADQPRLTATTPAGEAIALRPLAEGDLDAIVAACQDPESLAWTTVPDPYGPADAEFFVARHAPRRWRHGEGAAYAIVGPDDAFAGSMELRIGPGLETADVGFLTAPWARGRGYAATALRTLTDWGFDALGLHRIEWRAYVGNDASRKVAERAGFTIEGVSRSALTQRGRHRDTWVGARLRTD